MAVATLFLGIVVPTRSAFALQLLPSSSLLYLFVITASTGQSMPIRRSRAIITKSEKLPQQKEMLERSSRSLSIEYLCHTIAFCDILHELTLFLDVDSFH